MDPNSNLREQLELANRLVDGKVSAVDVATSRVADRLAELVVALHEWLSRGGALPNDWES